MDNSNPFGFTNYNTSDFSFENNIQNIASSFNASDSPYARKLADVGLGFREKMILAKQANLGKLAAMEGYRTGYILGADDERAGVDPDSGLVQDEATGDIFRFRMRQAGNYDAVDNADVVAKSRYKQGYQPEYVAAMNGKRVEELTDFDYKNVKNYQTQETFAAWQDPDHQTIPYDPNFIYSAPSADQRIPVLYKSTGSGFYGRDLTDMINPKTGRSMTFDAAMNPYLNASFQLGDYLDTDANRRRIDEFNALPAQPMKDRVSQKRIDNMFNQPANSRHPRTFESKKMSMDELVDKYQADRNDFMEFIDQLGYNVDKAQASIRQTIGHLARAVLPSSWIDEEYWKSLDKPVNEQGMTLADIISGVDPIQYAIHQRHNKENDAVWDKAKGEYEKGNYGMAAVNALNYLRKSIVDVNYLLADSFGQMAASSGGTMAGGAIGGVLGGMVGGPAGAKVGAHLGAFLTGAMVTAFDETVMARDQYKENNNGQDMSPERVLATFGAHLVAAAPEQVLQMMGLKKVLPNGIANAIFKGEEKIVTRAASSIPELLSAKGAMEAGKQVGKAFLGAGITEAGQEGFQNFVTAYASQDQKNPKSAWEVATDDEQLKAALAGFAMGGVMHGAATGIGISKALRSEKAMAEQQEQFEADRQNLTAGGGEADTAQSKAVIDSVSSIDLSASTSSADTLNIRNELNKKKDNLHLNLAAEEALFTKTNEAELYAVKQMRKEGKSVNQINKALDGKTIEDVLADKILSSNYNARWAFEHNVKPTQAVRDAAAKEILSLAKDLGISEEQAKKTMKDVASDIRRGPAGYESYIEKIRKGSKELDKSDLSEEDRASILNITGNTAKNLIHLFAYQQNKLEAFAKGFEAIDAGDVDNAEVTYPGGGKFTIYGHRVASTDSTSDRDVFGVIHDISSTLNEMGSFLKDEKGTTKDIITAAFNNYRNSKVSLPVDINLNENLIKRINNAVDRIQERGAKDFKSVPPVDSGNIKGYLNLTRTVATNTKNSRTDSKSYANDYRTLDKLLRRDDTAYDKLKKAIQNNRSYTEQEKLDYIAQLDAINSSIQRNRTNMSNMRADYAATTKEAEEALKTINEDFINSYVFKKGGTLAEYGSVNKPLTDARIKLAGLIANLRATASNTDIDKDLSKRLQTMVNLLQKRITENQNTFNDRPKQDSQQDTVQEQTRKPEFDREDLIAYNPNSLNEEDIAKVFSNVTIKGLAKNGYSSPLASLASSRGKVKNDLNTKLKELRDIKPENVKEDDKRYINSLRSKLKLFDILTRVLNDRKESVLTSKIDTTKYRKALGGMVDTILKAKDSDNDATKAPFDIWAHLNNELKKAKDELKTAENSQAKNADARVETAKLRLDLVEKRIAEVESLPQMMAITKSKESGVETSRTRRNEFAFTKADLKHAETELGKIINDYRINRIPDFEQNLLGKERITMDGKKVPIDLSIFFQYYDNEKFGKELTTANNKDWFKFHLNYVGELLSKFENPTKTMNAYLNNLVLKKGYSKELVDAMLESVITDLKHIYSDLEEFAKKAGFDPKELFETKSVESSKPSTETTSSAKDTVITTQWGNFDVKNPVHTYENTEVVRIDKKEYGTESKWLDKDHTILYIYGGRKNGKAKGSLIGNPAVLERDTDKARVKSLTKCWNDEEWLDKLNTLIGTLKKRKKDNPQLKKIVFGCYCVPKACHLDLVAKRVQDEVFGASSETAQETPEKAPESPETKGNGQNDESQGEAQQTPPTTSQEASEASASAEPQAKPIFFKSSGDTKYRFLSNFFLTRIKVDGHTYPSVEHAFQAAKTDKESEKKQFYATAKLTAKQAKAAGRKVTLRDLWDITKYDTLKNLVRIKFQNEKLKERLLATGNAALYEQTGDTTYGVNDKLEGKNMLGEILMDIRQELGGSGIPESYGKRRYPNKIKIDRNNKFYDMDGVSFTIEFVPREEFHNTVGQISSDKKIKIADDFAKEDLYKPGYKLSDSTVKKLESYGIDYNKIRDSFTEDEALEFIVQHERWHQKQIEKFGSYEKFNKHYNWSEVNKWEIELEALIMPLFIMGKFSGQQMRNALNQLERESFAATYLKEDHEELWKTLWSKSHELEDTAFTPELLGDFTLADEFDEYIAPVLIHQGYLENASKKDIERGYPYKFNIKRIEKEYAEFSKDPKAEVPWLRGGLKTADDIPSKPRSADTQISRQDASRIDQNAQGVQTPTETQQTPQKGAEGQNKGYGNYGAFTRSEESGASSQAQELQTALLGNQKPSSSPYSNYGKPKAEAKPQASEDDSETLRRLEDGESLSDIAASDQLETAETVSESNPENNEVPWKTDDTAEAVADNDPEPTLEDEKYAKLSNREARKEWKKDHDAWKKRNLGEKPSDMNDTGIAGKYNDANKDYDDGRTFESNDILGGLTPGFDPQGSSRKGRKKKESAATPPPASKPARSTYTSRSKPAVEAKSEPELTGKAALIIRDEKQHETITKSFQDNGFLPKDTTFNDVINSLTDAQVEAAINLKNKRVKDHKKWKKVYEKDSPALSASARDIALYILYKTPDLNLELPSTDEAYKFIQKTLDDFYPMKERIKLPYGSLVYLDTLGDFTTAEQIAEEAKEVKANEFYGAVSANRLSATLVNKTSSKAEAERSGDISTTPKFDKNGIEIGKKSWLSQHIVIGDGECFIPKMLAKYKPYMKYLEPYFNAVKLADEKEDIWLNPKNAANLAIRDDNASEDEVTELNQGRSKLDNSPHVRLLYNIAHSPNNRGMLTFSYNELTLAVIDFSIKEFIASSQFNKFVYPNDLDDASAAAMFHLSPDALSPLELKKIKHILATQGIPKSILASALGKLIMRNLGIKPNYATGEVNIWEQMAVGLGAFAVDTLTSDYSGIPLFKLNKWENKTEQGDKAIFAIKANELNLIKPIEKAKAVVDVLASKYLGTKTDSGAIYSENGVNRFKDTDNDYSSDPLFERPASITPDREVYVRNTQQQLKISDTQKQVLEKAQQQEWEIDEDIARYIINHREAIAKREGFIPEVIKEHPNPEFESLSFEAQLGAQGVNNSIRRRLDALQTFFNEQVKRKADGTWEGIFFKCFIGKNGRYYLDSSDFNPQTDKLLRTVCMPVKAKAKIAVNLTGEQLDCENFAIAQAFDHLGKTEKVKAFADKMRSLNNKALEEVRDVLTNNSDSAFSKWFKNEHGIEGVKAENYAQCLNVIQHLIRRNDAIVKDATEFETTLAVENDSTTSGYAIKMLDMPLSSVSAFLEKVGILSFVKDDADAGKIYLSDSEYANLKLTMDELKAREGFVDIYKTTATDVSTKIAELLNDKTNEKLKALFSDKIANSVYNSVKKKYRKAKKQVSDELIKAEAETLVIKQAEKMVELFRGMQAALPNLKNGKVDKYYRNLMKNPTMIFGYSASAKTISQKVAYNLMTDFIDGYLKIVKQGGLEKYIEANKLEGEEKAKAEAIFNTMQKIKPTNLNNTKNGGSLEVQLKKKFADEIWVYRGDSADGDSLTLARLFDTLLGTTYGDTAGKVLENKFKDYLCINNNMIWMSRQMEVWYRTVYDSEVDKLRAAHPKGYVTHKQMQEVREKLFKLGITPYTTLATNNPTEDDAKLFLYNNTKEVDNFTTVQNYIGSNGENKLSTTVYADVKVPSSPGRAGAVIPIHGQDGDIVMSTFLQFNDTYGMNIIHDAIVMNAFHQLPITQRYTELMFEMCAKHDIFATMRGNFDRVMNAYLDYFKDSKQITKDSVLKTKILNDKNKYILTLEQNKHIDDSQELFKMVGVEAEGYEGNVITVQDLIDNTDVWGKAVNRARSIFYGIPHFGINMGGAPGTGVRYQATDPIQKNFKNAYEEKNKVKGSNYDGYRTTSELNIIKSIAANDPEARVAILHDLHNMAMATNNSVSSDEHMKHMEEFIRLVNPKPLQDLMVQIADDGEFNAGQFIEKANGSKIIQIALDSKNDIDQVSKLAVKSYLMTPAEIYCHEIVHSATDYTFDNAVALGFNKEYTMAQHIYREISKLVKAEDLMPTENFNEALTEQYREHCQNTWNYIFNHPDHKTNRGFREFCAFFVSCEKFRNICKEKLTEKYKNEAQATKFIDKVIAFVKGIFDVIFGKEKFQNVFKRTYQSAKGLDTIKVQNMFDQMDLLINSMAQANHNATQRLLEHPRRSFENMFSFIGKFIQNYNTPVGQWLKKHTIELADTKGWFKLDPKLMKIGASKWDKAKLYSKVLALYPISARHRKAWRRLMIGVFKVSQDSVFRTVFREMTKPDYQSSLLELLSVKNGIVDASAKNIESYTRDDLKEHFGRNLKEDEEVSLTNCFLRTDAQCLGDTDYILKTLSDEQFVDSEAEKIEIKLREYFPKNDMYNWVCGQCVGLARFMVTEKGNEQLNTNAYAISVGHMFSSAGQTNPFTYNQEAEQLIDKLASLYAIQHTRKEFKNLATTLSRSGIENYLNTHKKFVEESKYGVKLDDEDYNNTTKIIDPLHVIKGYTKSLIDTTYETELNLTDAKTQREMAKQGFKLFYVINPNKVTQKTYQLGLYKRFGIPKRRDGGATSLQGYHAIGTTLEEMSFADVSASSIDYVEQRRKLHDIYKNNADKISEVLRNRMKSSPVRFEDFDRFSEGFSPIANPYIKGEDATDYRITMSLDNKRQALGLDERGITVLSKMYASINRKAQSSLANNEVIRFLEKDMEENMDVVTRYDKHGNNHKYILLDPLTDDKYLKDAWRVLPPEFKEYVKDHTLYVREDWLPSLFGVSNMSLNDTRLVRKIPFGIVKRAIAIAEMILKTIAYYRKQAIVLKIPAVLIGNIISNFMYSVANHQNPLKVLKRTIANAKAIREYLDTKKELGRIIMKERLGTATANEIASKNMLKSSLEANMVHPLMEQGMYQAIVEDLNPEDLESTSKLTKLLKYNKLTDKIPPSIKGFFNQLYIGRGTPIYEFMYTATQYSDFIARATEYQLRMEKAKSEYDRIQKAPVTKENEAFKRMSYKDFLKRYEKVTSIRVLNAFINYDKPQSKFGQYLNDIGLLMFSKFAKRIQHVIADQLWTNPIGAVMFLLSQHFIIDTEDIFEQNLFNKKWSALMNTPWENFVGAAIPMPIQFLTGQQKAF